MKLLELFGWDQTRNSIMGSVLCNQSSHKTYSQLAYLGGQSVLGQYTANFWCFIYFERGSVYVKAVKAFVSGSWA